MRLHAKIVSILREALTKLPNRSVGGDFKIDTLNDPDIENDHYTILDNVDDGSFTYIGRCPKGISGFKIWGDAHPVDYLDQEGNPIPGASFFYQDLRTFEDHMFTYMGFHWLAAFHPVGLNFLQFYDRNLVSINILFDKLTDPDKILDLNLELVSAWSIYTTRGHGVEGLDHTMAFGMFQMLAMVSDDLKVSELHCENHNDLLELVDGDRFHQLEFKNPYYVNAFEDGRYVLDDWAKLSCLGNNPVGGVFVAKDNTVIGYCDISFFSCRRSLGSWRVKHLRRDSFKDKEPWEFCWAPIRVEQKWLSSEQAKVVIATRIDMLCRDGYESSKNFRDLFEVIHGVKIRPWGSRHE